MATFSKFVALAAVCSLIGISATQGVGAQTPGSLDTTFATPHGKITDLFSGVNNLNASEIVLQRDGKIVISARCSGTNLREVCISRFNSDGAIDTTFGATTSDIPGTRRFAMYRGDNNPSSLFIDDDGRIVVIGVCSSEVGIVCAARLLENGEFDASFVGPSGDGGGHFGVQISNRFVYGGASATKAGRGVAIAFSCQSSINANPLLCVVKLREDGTLDSFFSSGGDALEVPIPGVAFVTAPTLKSTPDGKLVVIASCRGLPSEYTLRACSARLLASGTLDTSWKEPDQSAQGAFVFSPFAFLTPTFTLRGDGRVVVSGFCGSSQTLHYDACFVGLDESGALDLTFRGPSGGAGGYFRIPLGSGQYALTDLALTGQADGRVLAAGTCLTGADIPGADGSDTCLLRLNPDGSIDRSFVDPTQAANGFLRVSLVNSPIDLFPPVGSFDGARAVVVSDDGRTVTTLGNCGIGRTRSLCLARFHLGNTRPRVCSLDVDGDGKYTATLDGLILTRAMIGFSGETALHGVEFGNYSQRRTWVAIRAYLTEQCDMRID